jgi:hypothetical protein
VATLERQLHDRDVVGGRATLLELEHRTGSARANTSDVIWSAAGVLPFVGDDVSAVRGLAAAADDLARHGLPGLVDAAAALDPDKLTPIAGQVALEPIRRAAPAVLAAADALRSAVTQVAALDRPGLTAVVRDAVRTLNAKLVDAEPATDAAVRAVTLLPAMLGADGPRTYLLVFQNLAEVRSTGGIWGAWAAVHADNGRLTITRQGSAGDINTRLGHVTVDPQLEALYGKRIGEFFQDVNLTPDFPTAARLGREMFRQAYGESVDGVLATDPVALSYVLKGSPGLALPGGRTLTAGNAVQLLLSDLYREVPNPKDQDAVFAAAARGVFTTISAGGSARGSALISSIRQATSEGRTLLWSARPAEQAQLAATSLAGGIAGNDGPQLGVYFNDGTGAKLDYYLHASVTASCIPTGARLTVTVSSTAPVRGLPAYVLGGGVPGAALGTFRTNILIVAPPSKGIGSATMDGTATPVGTGVDNGSQVGVVTVDLPPEGTRTITVDVVGAKVSSTIRVTPTSLISRVSADRC